MGVQDPAMEEVVDGDDEDECSQGGSREAAQLLCTSTLPSTASVDWLAACADDVCAGGEDMANHTLMLTAQTEDLYVEEQLAAEAAEVPASEVAGPSECHTCTPEDVCFEDVKWAMEIG